MDENEVESTVLAPANGTAKPFKKRLSLRAKISGWATLLIVLTVVTTGALVLDRGASALTQEMIQRGRAMGANLATFSEEYLFKGIKQTPVLTTQAYDFTKSNGVIYAMVLDRAGRIVAHSDTKMEGKSYQLPADAELLDSDSPDAMSYRLEDGTEVIDIMQDVTLRGRAKLGTVHVGLSRAAIAAVVRESFLRVVIVATILIIMALIGTNLLVGLILKPVGALSRGAEAIGGGDLDTVISVKSRDELGQLAFAFNKMTARLKDAQNDLLAKERMDQELAVAERIQSSLLPDKCPKVPNYELASLYRPAVEVGGDYYDFLQPAAQEHGIIIADVSGKGVPASMGMTIARFALRAMSPHSSSPADLLRKVNRWLYSEYQEGMFVTVCYLMFNEQNHEVLFANAGHNPILHYRASDSAVLAVKSAGMAVGVDKGQSFDKALKEGQMSLASGDMVLLYTDGLSEAMNSKREEFGDDELPRLVKELGGASPEDFLKGLDDKLKEYTAGLPQFDDVTLVALKVK
jgi:serine phosphatase RsbU (regulator of sigma subunit)